MWKLRKWFWNRLATLKFGSNKPVVIPAPPDEQRKVNAVSLAGKYPAISIPNILVADRVPDDEAQALKLYFYKFQVAMYSLFSPMQPGLRPIDANQQKAFDEAYTSAHRKLFPPPALPEEFQNGIDLGRLAVASPYACYVERAPEGGYQWDLRVLDNYARHPNLRAIGARVLFRVNEAARQLDATRIDCDLGQCQPGDADWDLAQKIALCAATTHLSLVRHFTGVHLAVGGPLAMATRNNLPGKHPLRRLLWPHIHNTHFSNQLITIGQLSRGGEFEATFSFTHDGICKLLSETYGQYDVTVLDPERDAERRGINDAGFDTPALANRRALFDVMHSHTQRYLKLYYDTDEKLRGEANFRAWIEELNQLVPNGVNRLVGPELTIESAGRLLAAMIYMATVEHELLGTGLWNYQLWTNVQPVRVYQNGQRETLDVYQRLVNMNFNLNVRRARLMQDFAYLALDAKGADEFRVFRYELQKLQEQMDQEPPAPWKISPNTLEANINA